MPERLKIYLSRTYMTKVCQNHCFVRVFQVKCVNDVTNYSRYVTLFGTTD
jgi:hypothetical protein